jgi:hypothetical protein
VRFASKSVVLAVLTAAVVCWPDRLTPSVISAPGGVRSDESRLVSGFPDGWNWDGVPDDRAPLGLSDDDDDEEEDDDSSDSFEHHFTPLPDLGICGPRHQKRPSLILHPTPSAESRPLYLQVCRILC